MNMKTCKEQTKIYNTYYPKTCAPRSRWPRTKPTCLGGATRLGVLWNLGLGKPTCLGGATRIGGLWNLESPPASVGPPAYVDSGLEDTRYALRNNTHHTMHKTGYTMHNTLCTRYAIHYTLYTTHNAQDTR